MTSVQDSPLSDETLHCLVVLSVSNIIRVIGFCDQPNQLKIKTWDLVDKQILIDCK